MTMTKTEQVALIKACQREVNKELIMSLIGVDIDDPKDVQLTREIWAHAKDSLDNYQELKKLSRRSVVFAFWGGVFTILMVGIYQFFGKDYPL
jgi:hypothetical protein